MRLFSVHDVSSLPGRSGDSVLSGQHLVVPWNAQEAPLHSIIGDSREPGGHPQLRRWHWLLPGFSLLLSSAPVIWCWRRCGLGTVDVTWVTSERKGEGWGEIVTIFLWRDINYYLTPGGKAMVWILCYFFKNFTPSWINAGHWTTLPRSIFYIPRIDHFITQISHILLFHFQRLLLPTG